MSEHIHDDATEPMGDSRSFAASLAAGGDDGQYVVPEEKQRVSRTTIAFAGMAVLAGAGLFLMKQRAGGPATAAGNELVATSPDATAARQSIQTFLAGGAAEVNQVRDMLADTEAIRDRFGQLSRDRQVPLGELKTNPFWREDAESVDQAIVEGETDEAYARRLATERERLRKEGEQQLAADAKKLDLGTVLLGSRPTCQINGQFCRVGDTVGDDLTIADIRREGIVVKRGDHVAFVPLVR